MPPNQNSSPQDKPSDGNRYLIGVGYGLTLAFCGGMYTTFARHGVLRGLSPYDLTAMRFGIAAFLFLPVLLKWGLKDMGGLGWPRALALTFFAGPPFSLLVFTGFRFAPLSHGGVIMPASITLTGILMSAWLFGEHPSKSRWFGVAAIFTGLMVLGGDALLHGSGAQMLLGDFMFFISGGFWAAFGLLVKHWRANPDPGGRRGVGFVHADLRAVLRRPCRPGRMVAGGSRRSCIATGDTGCDGGRG
ncbi:MAG: DMT family transporter [Rhodospirillales bacterium]